MSKSDSLFSATRGKNGASSRDDITFRDQGNVLLVILDKDSYVENPDKLKKVLDLGYFGGLMLRCELLLGHLRDFCRRYHIDFNIWDCLLRDGPINSR